MEESGKVTGAKAVDKNGNSLIFKANAVVMATGGFGANEELFVKYRPDLSGFTTTNHPGLTEGYDSGDHPNTVYGGRLHQRRYRFIKGSSTGSRCRIAAGKIRPIKGSDGFEIRSEPCFIIR